MKAHHILRKIFAAALAFIVLCMFSGCLSSGVQELYSLPEPSEGYLALQKKINSVLSSGAEYSSPVSGENRQPVQLNDIDGDGVNEAIAFFKIPGEKSLKIYIFRAAEGVYEEAALIEGDGTSIESVSYADLNGDGSKEIIVGWKMSGGMQMLGVYSLRDYEVTSELLTGYTNYIASDLDGDGVRDLTVVRYDRSAMTGSAEAYFLRGSTGMESSSARLSPTLESIDRIRTTKLTDGRAAIFVEGLCGSGSILTDVLTFKDAALQNISADTETGVSRDTVRAYSVYSGDIDSNGCLDIPEVQTLPAPESAAAYRIINWYNYSSAGKRVRAVSTYHNYSDGWYLVLPDEWTSVMTLSRDDSVPGERSMIFSVWNGEEEPAQDFLIISALTGSNRYSKAEQSGRFVLKETSDAIYTAAILRDKTQWKYAPDREELIAGFGIIYSEWLNGTT
ncbi:MAG: VCBS repeat-containing protein [Oscillospiraceae bacterium]|nr:VCBS repeat-containing protein [Oscillospiraceae bacterium]